MGYRVKRYYSNTYRMNAEYIDYGMLDQHYEENYKVKARLMDGKFFPWCL